MNLSYMYEKELISLNKNCLVPVCKDFKEISNFGNIKKYRLLERAYNGRYRVETYRADDGYWIVFVDKKDRLEPVPFLYESYAGFWRKFSTVKMEFRRLCRKYRLDNREKTHWYWKAIRY